MKAVVENGKFDDAVSLGLVLSREWSAVLDRLAVKEQIMQKRQDDGLRRKRRGEREASKGSCQINPRGAEKKQKSSQLLRQSLAKCGGAAALEGSLCWAKVPSSGRWRLRGAALRGRAMAAEVPGRRITRILTAQYR